MPMDMYHQGKPIIWKNNRLYVVAEYSYRPNDFHWSIFMCVSQPFGQLYHATDRRDKWEVEEKMTDQVVESIGHRAVIELCFIPNEQTMALIHETLKKVTLPAEGTDFGYYSQEASRLWVRKALLALERADVIKFLCPTVSDIEMDLMGKVNRVRNSPDSRYFTCDLVKHSDQYDGCIHDKLANWDYWVHYFGED